MFQDLQALTNCIHTVKPVHHYEKMKGRDNEEQAQKRVTMEEPFINVGFRCDIRILKNNYSRVGGIIL